MGIRLGIGNYDRCRLRMGIGRRVRRTQMGQEVYFLRLDRTLPPARRASLSPIAMACLRLVTFLPERPDLSCPRFISCMARLTFLPAFAPYLRRLDDFRCAMVMVPPPSFDAIRLPAWGRRRNLQLRAEALRPRT